MLRSASCSNCKRSLPMGPGFFKVKPAPYTMTCKHCENTMKTTFWYRATWQYSNLWKLCIVGGFILGIVTAAVDGRPVPYWLFSAVVTGLLLGGLGGFIVAIVLAPVVQVPIEIMHSIIKKFGA